MSKSNANLLADFLDLEPFAKEVDRDPRTVRRWLDQPNGLPYSRIGNRILIHVPTAREWIFGRMRNQKKRPIKPRPDLTLGGANALKDGVKR
jgi:hypothetical protein